MGAIVSTQGAVYVAVALISLYAGRQAMLPRPLPDIPHNLDAANKLFGDVPEMMGHVMRTKRIFVSSELYRKDRKQLTRASQDWLTSLTSRHHSPIIQAFITPMALPWVVVTDPFEAQDILLRRKEFDRSGFFGDLINGILPEQHIQFISTDPRFRNNRNLINHLMTPAVVNRVLVPRVHGSVMSMIRMWQIKSDIAEGRPFSAHNDITYMALDTIFAAMFGHPEEGLITPQRLEATTRYTVRIPKDRDEAVEFPDTELPTIFSAALTLANSVTDTQLSPAPRLTSWVLRCFPYMKNAIAIKDQYIRDRVNEMTNLIEAGDENLQTGLHSVLLRERDVANNEGRQPEYQSRGISDEFFGFMLAGHDTSATTVAWGLKYIADHPAAQNRLREGLRASLTIAVAEKRAPTAQELVAAHIPYLDAVVEEVLRHANTIAFVVRRAQRDTTVLGRHIPKGTDVFLMANGAGFLEPNMPCEDDVRSPGARRVSGKALTGAWDDDGIGEFRPERWLKADIKTGVEVFDSMAGPQLAFGLGPRACFGRRFAMQELKIQFALIVWHFVLKSTPGKLSGYDSVQRFAREPVDCYVRLEKVVM